MRAISWTVLAVGAFALGCSMGGQSSDDGAPHEPELEPRDTESPDASLPGPDAGPPVTRINFNVPLEGGEGTIACAAGFDSEDVVRDRLSTVLAAPQRCTGLQGGFECVCDGELRKSYAFGCEAALFEACGVAAWTLDADAAPAPIASECAASNNTESGACATDDEQYLCSCGHPLSEPQPSVAVAMPAEPTPASCEQALFDACALPCSDDWGACEPTESGAIGEYACTCSTNELTRVVGALDCERALLIACTPINGYGEGCSGYGGYCENTDPVAHTTMRCTCADGEQQDVPFDPTARSIACRDTLEATCGLGAPPEGAVCMAEGNGFSARCTRGRSDEATQSCECYSAKDWSPRYGSIEDSTCDTAALQDFCAEIVPLEPTDRRAACAHLDACGSRITDFTVDACMDHATDSCIACLKARLSRAVIGDDGCPEERVLCSDLCDTIVPHDEAIAACKARAAEPEPLTVEESCLCDRCYPDFGNCLADAGCTEIIGCAAEQSCQGGDCQLNPVCGPIIQRYLSTWSLSLALQLSGCEHRDACAALH